MKLFLSRQPKGITCTIGDLSIESEPFCNTLEPLNEIPPGTYPVQVTWSNRFQRDLPLVENVPDRTGIRIHAGNTDHDTTGCILVGVWTGGEFVHNSMSTLEALLDRFKVAQIAKEQITLEITEDA